jgi:hypothetical protein
MFYVGHTINLESRMIYGHFGKFINRVEFLKRNSPLELIFIIETGITYSDHINIHDIEDYVTVVVSKNMVLIMFSADLDMLNRQSKE